MSVPPTPQGRPVPATATAIATELWILVIVAQCVVYGSQYPQFFDAADEVAKDNPDALLPDGVIWAVIGITGAGLAIVFAGLTWLARIGYNWARLALGFFSFFLVVQAVSAFFADGSDSWAMIPTVISGVAALGAGVLLMHRDSDTYCKDMSRWRAEQKLQPPSYYASYPQQTQYPQAHHPQQPPYPPEPGDRT